MSSNNSTLLLLALIVIAAMAGFVVLVIFNHPWLGVLLMLFAGSVKFTSKG